MDRGIAMRKIISHIVLFLGAVLMSLLAFSQQDAQFNQYMFNPLGINPAYAGSREALSVVGLFRNQWVGFQGAPVTQTFSIHSPLAQKKMGLGFQITNDNIGPRNNVNAQVAYAYRIKLFGGQLGFGLGMGVQYLSFDWNKLNTATQTTPSQRMALRQLSFLMLISDFITTPTSFISEWKSHTCFRQVLPCLILTELREESLTHRLILFSTSNLDIFHSQWVERLCLRTTLRLGQAYYISKPVCLRVCSMQT